MTVRWCLLMLRLCFKSGIREIPIALDVDEFVILPEIQIYPGQAGYEYFLSIPVD